MCAGNPGTLLPRQENYKSKVMNSRKKDKRNVGELEEYRTNEGFPNFILKTDLQTKKTQKLSKYQIEEMQVKYLSIPK